MSPNEHVFFRRAMLTQITKKKVGRNERNRSSVFVWPLDVLVDWVCYGGNRGQDR
ncbi:hypothetical protein HanHA300_Chr02g0068521 [Helianthus annuus]|nr:hypothetical protein HanHA300_Chr02g0068521 [Helianthus annuus]KAJ0616839.1 hypothetical protein HanIR_Chr02g0094961 [Helianthus annuus]